MRTIHLNILLLVCVLMMTLAVAVPAGAVTRYVPSPYPTIQGAIDASAMTGDEIEVAPGIYEEAINFNGKAIRLYSSGGADVTTIDGTGNYHVVQCVSGEDANTILEGFTITGGNANGSTDIEKCGGGMFNLNSSPTVTNCIFTYNDAEWGGGMHNEDGSPELTGCVFTDNRAESGGGMYNDSWHEPAAGNRVILTNCKFTGNSAPVAGGGIYNTYCDSNLTNCTFEDNSTSDSIKGGGGIYNDRSIATLTNCTFNSNTTTNGSGGGLYNSEYSGSNMVGCVFTDNSAFYHGCGMYNRGDAMVVNCTFSSNSGTLYSHSGGGGIADFYGQSLTVVNCIFTGNSAGFGGGMFNRISRSVKIVNCTFSSNSATYSNEGGGIYNRECDPIIMNCIIWGNIGEQIYNYDSTAEPNITYSCIQGGYFGIGNISVYPMFSSSDFRLQDGSPCIDAGSNDALPPDTLDVDNDSDTTELIPWDRACKLRRADDPAVEPDTGDSGTIGPPVVDMGAYEVSPIFVEDNAPSGGDGSSWPTAYKYLQDALLAAADPLGGKGEIRVAQGTYYPDQSEWGHVTPADREATFELQNNLIIRGGYRGLGAGGGSNDRNIKIFETILSGDYANNDDQNEPNSMDENSYHVAGSNNTDASALLEGFTITAGNANGGPLSPHSLGGGMLNSLGSCPTVAYCTFKKNSANTGGGGMCNFRFANPNVINCIFRENSSHNQGGGMSNYLYSRPLVTNCSFRGNSAGNVGGGIFNSNAESVLTNCTFIGNSAYEGGGMYSYYNTTSSMQQSLTNCTFCSNTAYTTGGIYFNSLREGKINPTLTNCIFWGNRDSNGVGENSQIFASGPNVEVLVTCSCIQGCSEYCSDPNGYNFGGEPNDNPQFVRDPNDGGDGWVNDPCTPGVDESINDDYGDLRLSTGSPCVDTGNNDVDTDANTPEIDPLPDTDLEGHPRILDGDCNDVSVVDIGAYELNYAYMGDLDYNCTVDFFDFSIFGRTWMTQEGDLNGNWVCDVSDPPDDYINWHDVATLCNNWLAQIP
jgi:hypothetical protein